MKIVSVSVRGLGDNEGRPFEGKVGGKKFRGFVVKRGDSYYAYKNMCKHVPVSLDAKEGQFFTGDKKYLICGLHGATYEVETGKCVQGPCVGASLDALEFETEGETLLIHLPESQ